MKILLQKILAVLARATIRKYQPRIIGITGSVGKTSTREAIFAALKKRYKVRVPEKNYNNEIGLPLTILGIPHYGKNVFRWLFGLLKSCFNRNYPEILILEYGIDHPGDMDALLSIAKPHIAVVTAIGEIPVHVEFFQDPEELVKEKAKLVQALPADGHAVLNHDDVAVFDLKTETKAKVLTFGFDEHAQVKIMNYKLQLLKDEKLGDVPDGITFKIEQEGHIVPFRLHGVLGEPLAYAAAAAAGVATALGLNLVEVSQALEGFVAPPGRMRLLRGIRNSLVFDDSYNAAPEAMRSAVALLHALPGRRKIAVLGDMLEIGKYAEQVHRSIGDQIALGADLLLAVGPRAKFIAEEAKIKKANMQIMEFADSRSAGKALDPLIQAGDLILVKGSQAMRMERVVEEIMAEPQRAKELLVRQEEYWEKNEAVFP